MPTQALNGIMNNPHVLYVEEDPIRQLMGEVSPYGIAMVQADQLSDSAAGSRNLCIIDSGYDMGHPDLPSSNVSGTSNSGTGDWFTDENSHGTHVAGTIAAVANNEGVVGVMPNGNISLHIIKVFNADGWGYSSGLIAALDACEAAGANVVSMSLGGSRKSRSEETGFAASASRGVLSIAAAGNDGNTRHSYPASYSSVVSVAAIDSSMNVASFSQQTNQVELSGPGVGVLSTVPRGMGSEVAVNVGGTDYAADAMDNSFQGTGSGSLVDCGTGETSCAGASGNVCLIQRGNISFADKVLACQNSGGSAAIIYNNEPGALLGTLDVTVTSIPSVGVSDTDGAAMLSQLGQSSSVTVDVGDYASFDGTSMATPHVSAVAALVWSHYLSCSADDIRSALSATAMDLGTAGRDDAYGYGLVQAADAAAYLSGQSCGGGTPVNQAPTASFSFSCSALSCDFDGSGSSDSDGSVVGYSWDFGDGATATGATASHTYAGDGSYSVTLTVMDDDGADGSDNQNVSVSSGGTGGISLSTNGFKVRGKQNVDLSWSGANSSNVDIYRDGVVIATTANDGAYTDNIGAKGGAVYVYQVCEAGTSTCSSTSTVVF
jgi:subtilisin family serine protease